MKRKHYFLLLVLFFVFLIAIVAGIGISEKKKNATPRNDIQQSDIDNNEGIMEDEVFEKNYIENDELDNKQDITTIPENEINDDADSKKNGNRTESSDDGDKEESNDDSEPPKDDSVELPRIPLN